MKSVWNWLGLLWAVSASSHFLFVPAHSMFSSSTTIDSSGALTVATEGRETLASNEGAFGFVVLAIPVLIAAVALFPVRAEHRRIIAAAATVLLAAFVVLSLASIGLFYAPAVLALVVGAFCKHERPAES